MTTVYDAREIIGWLNHLFGERYTNSRATNLWRIYQLLPDYRKDDNLLPLLPDDVSMDVLGTMIYLAVTRENHEEDWKQLIAVPPHGPEEITLPDCIRIVENALKDLKASDETSEAEKLEQLKIVLKAGDQELPPETPELCRFIGGTQLCCRLRSPQSWWQIPFLWISRLCWRNCGHTPAT